MDWDYMGFLIPFVIFMNEYCLGKLCKIQLDSMQWKLTHWIILLFKKQCNSYVFGPVKGYRYIINLHFQENLQYKKTTIERFIKFTKWYLYYTELLSIQQHTPCHTDRSRDYIQSCLYSVQNTDVYSLDHTNPQCILLVKWKDFVMNFSQKNSNYVKNENFGTFRLS